MGRIDGECKKQHQTTGCLSVPSERRAKLVASQHGID